MGRGLALVGILIALAASTASAAAPSFDTTRLYSEAEFAAAIKPYVDSIARNANDAEAHYRLGAAYLYAYKLYKFGLAPYAAEYGGRAVASLERSVQIKADPVVFLTLLEAYVVVEGRMRERAHDGLIHSLPPLPLK